MAAVGPTDHFVFRHSPILRVYLLVLFPAFLATIAIIVGMSSQNGSSWPWPSLVFFLGIFGWNAYWWLFRVALRLDVSEGWLTWQTALRSGRDPIASVMEIRPLRGAGGCPAIVLAEGSKIPVLPGRGFRTFAEALGEQRPGIPIRLGLFATIYDRLWFGSRFRREPESR